MHCEKKLFDFDVVNIMDDDWTTGSEHRTLLTTVDHTTPAVRPSTVVLGLQQLTTPHKPWDRRRSCLVYNSWPHHTSRETVDGRAWFTTVDHTTQAVRPSTVVLGLQQLSLDATTNTRPYSYLNLFCLLNPDIPRETFHRGSKCGNKTSDANILRAFYSKYRSILLSIPDMTTRCTDDWPMTATIWPLK